MPHLKVIFCTSIHHPENHMNVFLSETIQLYFFINGCHYSVLTHVHSRKIHFSVQLQVLY